MRAPKPDKAHSMSQGFMYILLYIHFFILPALKILARESARESVRRASNTLSLFRTSRILSQGQSDSNIAMYYRGHGKQH